MPPAQLKWIPPSPTCEGFARADRFRAHRPRGAEVFGLVVSSACKDERATMTRVWAGGHKRHRRGVLDPRGGISVTKEGRGCGGLRLLICYRTVPVPCCGKCMLVGGRSMG